MNMTENIVPYGDVPPVDPKAARSVLDRLDRYRTALEDARSFLRDGASQHALRIIDEALDEIS